MSPSAVWLRVAWRGLAVSGALIALSLFLMVRGLLEWGVGGLVYGAVYAFTISFLSLPLLALSLIVRRRANRRSAR